MAIDTEVRYDHPRNLLLDPKNPRLGRRNTEAGLSQEAILAIMKEWTLDELAVSFIENNFWPQEALMVVEEELYGSRHRIVVEGNRRLAALQLLFDAKDGRPASPAWAEMVASCPASRFDDLSRVPYLKAGSRQDVQAYLGFRHVTGIKQWEPAEKAEFIADLIDNQGMSYQQVTRKIGSRVDAVRQNYISYRLLLQMEETEGISVEHVEDKFSVLYLSLRTVGVQTFLDIDIRADVARARTPVPPEKLDHLVKFALWLFGTEEREPVVTDSRQIDRFGKALQSPQALAYLERTKFPKLEVAFRLAGGDEAETRELIEQAADNVEQALSTAHHHTDSELMARAVRRLGKDAVQLLSVFPDIKKELMPGS